MKFTLAVLILSSLLLAACHRSAEPPAAPVAANRNEAAAVTTAAHPACVNLNRATAAELMQLPGIGAVMSRRIIDYRDRHGPFRRPAEIIIIEGFSEKKYRALAERICVE